MSVGLSCFSSMNPPQILPGICVGQASNFQGLTGCTVVLAARGAVCGVDVRGSAAGTRELVACFPDHLVEWVHAVFHTGGSAFGLDAVQGVTGYLENLGVGFPTGRVRVPIVPTAVLFDLNLGPAAARPTAGMALEACRQSGRTVSEGSAGAVTGATVGKLLGMECATKGGQGFASLRLTSGVLVQSLAVVNSFGDVIDPKTSQILAGARLRAQSHKFADTYDSADACRAHPQDFCGRSHDAGGGPHRCKSFQTRGRQGGTDGARRYGPRRPAGSYAVRWRHHIRPLGRQKARGPEHSRCCRGRSGGRGSGARRQAGLQPRRGAGLSRPETSQIIFQSFNYCRLPISPLVPIVTSVDDHQMLLPSCLTLTLYLPSFRLVSDLFRNPMPEIALQN